MAQTVASPRVSVIMPVYNAERYVAEAIDSILGQTYKDFEFIIINDGSTDGSLQLIKSYKDPRIHIISRKNKGLVASLNEGIKLARGDYIARMDADDVSYSERFAAQVKFLDEKRSVDLIGAQITTIDEGGKSIDKIISKPVEPRDIQLLLGHGSIIAHPTVMLRRSALVKVGGYNQKYWPAEDFDLWQRMALQGMLANLPAVLLKYRISQMSISQSSSSEQLLKSRALARNWRKKHIGYRKITQLTGLLKCIMRYKRTAKLLPGYSLKNYLLELLLSTQEDIKQSSLISLERGFFFIKIKLALVMLRLYG